MHTLIAAENKNELKLTVSSINYNRTLIKPTMYATGSHPICPRYRTVKSPQLPSAGNRAFTETNISVTFEQQIVFAVKTTS